jgi:hypothetical protein
MKKPDLGQLVGILANLGVIAGIVFLSLQINQANRIATQQVRTELTARHFDLQKSVLENAELADLLFKLQSADTDLTPREQIQAQSYAALLLNIAATANVSVQSRFVTEATLQANMLLLRDLIRRSPGIKPYLREVMTRRGTARGESPFFDAMLDEMARL